MYNADKLTSIDLGRQGENLARTVEIDVSGMLAQWPDAVITLLVKRKHDAETSTADTPEKDGVLFWPIPTAETVDAGEGKLEIRATCGEVIAKSATGSFRVTASLTGSGTEPPATEPVSYTHLATICGRYFANRVRFDKTEEHTG